MQPSLPATLRLRRSFSPAREGGCEKEPREGKFRTIDGPRSHDRGEGSVDGKRKAKLGNFVYPAVYLSSAIPGARNLFTSQAKVRYQLQHFEVLKCPLNVLYLGRNRYRCDGIPG